jgi:two-component system OmpR family response regulator
MNAEPLRAVIVEDNLTLRESLVATLEALAEVRVIATSGMEAGALAWLRAHPHDWQVLIVDLFLRSGSGLHLIEQLGPRRPDQKVVVFSNYVNATVRKRCAQLGADAVFDKSTELDALVDYCARQRFLLASSAASARARQATWPSTEPAGATL